MKYNLNWKKNVSNNTLNYLQKLYNSIQLGTIHNTLLHTNNKYNKNAQFVIYKKIVGRLTLIEYKVKVIID
jgi:hypothetical protein